MVQVLAHRGLSGEKPENTLAAFEAAAVAGFDGIELDVQLTHDKHLFVMHDANIARTTDGVGRINDLDLVELQTHPTAAGPAPTLPETFDALPDWQGLWNIEAKAWRAAKPAAALIIERGLQDRAMITSMDPRALEAVHKYHPEIARGLIVLGPPDSDDVDAAKETCCTWWMLDHNHMDERAMDRAKAEGLRVGCWTVNEIDEATRVVDLGAEMVMTDVREVLEALR